MMILGLDIAGQGLLGITLELAAESLEESIRLNFRHQPDLLILKDDNGMEDAVAIYSRYISVVLYLCSRTGQRDIIPPASRRERPQPGTAPKTVKLAFENTVWDVGTSMGQALRAAFTEQEDVPTGNTLRSHIRRSHWHTFLSGPRTGPRIRTLKWLPPVLIKFDQEQGDPDVSSTVVHPDLTPPDQEPGD